MTSAQLQLRWTWGHLAGDYARAGFGLVILTICIAFAPAGSWWQWLLLGLSLLFVMFLFQVVTRHATLVTVSDLGIRCERPFARTVEMNWAEVKNLDVRFYPSTRDRRTGWMTAKISGKSGSILLDDRLPGFEDTMQKAMFAVERSGFGLNTTTAANLASLGLGLKPKGYS